MPNWHIGLNYYIIHRSTIMELEEETLVRTLKYIFEVLFSYINMSFNLYKIMNFILLQVEKVIYSSMILDYN